MLLPIFLYFQVKATAENVDEAVRELPDANLVRYSFFFCFVFEFGLIARRFL